MGENDALGKVRTILRFTKEIVWSERIDGIVARILGALALIALARYTAKSGLSHAASEIFEYYDALLKVFLGWLDPYFKTWITSILAAFEIDVKFNPYWRHIFVVMQILFVRDAGVAFATKRPVTGYVRLIVGSLVAAAIAVLAALEFLNTQDWVENFLFATLLTLGVYLYDIVIYIYSALFRLKSVNDAEGWPGRNGWKFLKSAISRATWRLTICFAASSACFLIPEIRNAVAPRGGLVAIGAATIANALYWLWRGSKFANKEAKNGEDWIDSFKQSEAGRFGAAITGVFAWIVIFSTLNAGMKQLGL